jgi:hypothetical protein
MTVESDVRDMYLRILKRYAAEDTARVAALTLCRELMPDADDRIVRETTARAIAAVRIAGTPANDVKPNDRQATTKQEASGC